MVVSSNFVGDSAGKINVESFSPGNKKGSCVDYVMSVNMVRIKKNIVNQEQKSMSERITKTALLPIFLIIVFGSILYSNTLNVPFYFDDTDNIKNPALRFDEISFEKITGAVFEGTLKERPVSNISFALNYYFGGYRVQGYHAVNIAIHLLAAVFLYFLIRATLALPANREKFKAKSEIAFFATLLWLVHPLATQSVTYLVQRMNSLAAMFYVLSLLLYVEARNRQQRRERRRLASPPWMWFLLSGCTGLLAIGAKEIAATLPIMIFFYEWYFLQDLSWKWIRKKFAWLIGVVLGFCFLAFFYLGKAPWQVLFSDCSGRDFTAYERLLTQFRVVIHYISLLFYPNPERLTFDYDFPLSTSFLSPPTTLFSFVGIVLLIVFIIVAARSERLFSFCVLWFLGTLVIESSVICLEIIFEHRTYLPGMFFLLLVVATAYRFGKNRYLITGLFVCVAMLFAYWTHERNGVWQDTIGFWQDSVSKSPAKSRPYNNLGESYTRSKDYVLAEKNFKLSYALDPSASIPLNNLGILCVKLNRTQEAEEYFRKAIEIKANYFQAYNNLATILTENGRFDEAIGHLQYVLQEVPNFYLANKSMGNTLLKAGRPGEAVRYLQVAVEMKPSDSDCLLNLGIALMQSGNDEEAIQTLRDVLSKDNASIQANYNLAMLLSRNGDEKSALVHYQKAASLAPPAPPVMYNLANQLYRLDKYDEAARAYVQFLSIVPTVADAFNNLGLTLLRQGQPSVAVKFFQETLKLIPEHQLALRNLEIAQAQSGMQVKSHTGKEEEK